jgi:hypothetical protein
MAAHASPDLPPLDERLLAAAPELATLALLDNALVICTTALIAEHPTLDHDLRSDPDPPTLREARRLIAAARRFRCTVARYRRAVIDSLAPLRDHDTDPF